MSMCSSFDGSGSRPKVPMLSGLAFALLLLMPFAIAQEVVHVAKPMSNRVFYFDAGATTWPNTSYFTACGPFALAANELGTRLYTASFCSIGPSHVTVIDTTTSPPAEITRLPLTNNAFDIDVHPDGSRVFVPDFNGSRVSIIDTAKNTYIEHIPLDSGPFGLKVAPNGEFAYVSLFSPGTVRRIDLSTNTVVGDPILSGPGAFEIAFSPNADFAFVTNQNTANPGSVTVIDVAAAGGVKVIAVGDQPQGIAMQPLGSKLYVANQFSGSVSVITIEPGDCLEPTEEPPCIQDTIALGGNPVDVAFTADGAFAFVSNEGGNSVHEIDTATDTVIRTISLSTSPSDPGPRGLAVVPPPPPEPLTLSALPTTIAVGGISQISTGGGSGTAELTVSSGGSFCALNGSELSGLAAGECTVTATDTGLESGPESLSILIRVAETSGVDLEIGIVPFETTNTLPSGIPAQVSQGCETAQFDVIVNNRGPEPASQIRLQSPGPGGLISPLSWSCTAPAGSCSPASGTTGIDTQFALAVGDSATIQWQGCPDPLAGWVEIRASASLPDGATLLFPETSTDLVFLPINSDGVFRDRLE